LLDQFVNFSLINSITLPEELLKTKTEASLDLLRQISSATLVRPLTLVNRMAQANEFVTALPTNSIAVTEHFGLSQIIITVDDLVLYLGMFANRYVLNGTTAVDTSQNK
ncbi:unnamed protein product, partial [Rotaria sp. Silwood2]